MNWGYRILIVYVVFAAGIVFMVVKASTQKTDLVMPDYYEQELKYQATIDATVNANALTAKLNCVVKNDTLFIEFPAEMKNTVLKTELLLYCVADKNRDLRKTIETTGGPVLLPLGTDNKGMHDIKINWQANGKNYYYEEKIFLQ
jgi:hypothetical protein